MATSIGTLEGLLVLRDEFTGALTRATDQLAQSGKRIEQLGQNISNVGSRLTATLTLPLVVAGGAAIKFATEFESSFAGVRKTVDATEEEFTQLAQGMRDLARTEIPIDVNELNAIGEAAGQLGIRTENILSFTRVMADLGVATNLTSEQAAVSMARIANVTGLPQDQFDRLGSTVVALGNTFATTESEIVEFGTRIAGAGKLAGLTEAQILGIGTAMSSIGVQAEAGGTSVQKVLLGMIQAIGEGGEELRVFAETAGVSSAEFAKLFEEDAGAAFTAFVEGLGRQGNAGIGTLQDLGLANERVIRSFLSLAGAGDLLSRALDTGTVAFAENTALAKEAAQRYATFESQLTLAWNRIKDVAITLGTALLPVLLDGLKVLEPWVDKLADLAARFAQLPASVRTTTLVLVALAAAAGPLLFVTGQMVSAFGALTAAAPVMAKAVTLALGPWGAIALAIGAATVAIRAWIDVQNTAHTAMLKSLKRSNDYAKSVVALRNELIDARDSQRALSDEMIETVGRGLAGMVSGLDVARGKLDEMRESAKKLRGSGFGPLNKDIEKQAALVKRLENEYKVANKLVTDAVAAQAELKGEVEEANDVLVVATGGLEDYGDAVDTAADVTSALSGEMEGVTLNLSALTSPFEDNTEAVERNWKTYELLKGTVPGVSRTLDELADITNRLRTAMVNGDISAEQYSDAIDRINTVSEETTDTTSKLADGFANAIADMVINATSLDDALEALLLGDQRSRVSSFVDSFVDGFSKAKDAGLGAADSLKKGWQAAKENLIGVGAAISAGFAASFGETEDIAIAALTSIMNFAQGNLVGGFIAAAGAILGAIKSIFSKSKKTAKDLAKELGFALSDELLKAIDTMKSRTGGLESALRANLSDVIREVGISSVRELRKFVSMAGQLINDLGAGTVNARVGIDALSGSLDQILDKFEDVSGTIGALNQIAATYTLLLNQMRAGTISAAHATEVLESTFAKFFNVARMLGQEGADAIRKVVEESRAAGIEVEAFASTLKATVLEALEIVEQRNQFLVDQSMTLLAGLEQMLADSVGLTKRQVDFAATSILDAFGAMAAAGVPLTDIIAELGDAFALIEAAGLDIGAVLPEGFERLGEIIDILAEGPIRRATEQLAGMATVTEALGNLGVLSAEQFDTFGDSVRNTFRRLISSGLTSEEALAALAPQLQLLNDLS